MNRQPQSEEREEVTEARRGRGFHRGPPEDGVARRSGALAWRAPAAADGPLWRPRRPLLACRCGGTLHRVVQMCSRSRHRHPRASDVKSAAPHGAAPARERRRAARERHRGNAPLRERRAARTYGAVRILIVDDEPVRAAALIAAARRACPAAQVTSTAGDAVVATEDTRARLVVLGPGHDAGVLRMLRARRPDVTVVVVSARDTADAA